MTWRNQPVIVEGKPYTLDNIHGGTLYHGTTVKLPPGTQLTPQPPHKRNFPQSPATEVCFTSDKATAIYWARKTATNPTAPIYIHEIEPDTKVTIHRIMPTNYGKNINLLEGRSPTATIIKTHTINP